MAKKKFTRSRKQLFLNTFSQTGIIADGLAAAGISRTTLDKHLKEDYEFARQFWEADQEATDRIEKEARRRAIEGWDEPQYFNGKLQGYVRRYSDRLLEKLLVGRRREVYGNHSSVSMDVEHSGKIEVQEAKDKLINVLEGEIENRQKDAALEVERGEDQITTQTPQEPADAPSPPQPEPQPEENPTTVPE